MPDDCKTASKPESGDVSDDAVLGGRLRLRQPRRGHRVGHDAVLLAAACPARAGETVVDLGAGVGAAGLALAARVCRLLLTLVEIDPALAVLAGENAQRNQIAARVIVADAIGPARALAVGGLAANSADRVLMNPPFNDPARQRSSPEPQRRLAHAAPAAMLTAWVATAGRLLRQGGTLSLIWRADGLGDVMSALAGAGFGAIAVLPVHPRPEEPAIRVLVRATKASRAPLVLWPGLVLNDTSGRPTPQAEAVLRNAAALWFGEM